MLPNNLNHHPHLNNNYYLDEKHQYNRQCVPTQQDGSFTGRHSVLDVKLFTHPGSYVALEESCQPSRLSVNRCSASVRQVSCHSRASTSHYVTPSTPLHRAAPRRAERSRERTDGRRDTLCRERSEVSPETRGDGSHKETVT